MKEHRLEEIREWSETENTLQPWELAPELRKVERYTLDLLSEVDRLRGIEQRLEARISEKDDHRETLVVRSEYELRQGNKLTADFYLNFAHTTDCEVRALKEVLNG